MRLARCRRVAPRWRRVFAVLCAVANIGWLGAERDRAGEGNRLYDAGRYDEAVTAYGEGLVEHPESEYLRFNLGAAQYRQGSFPDAVATLEKLLPDMPGEGSIGPPPSETPEMAAEAAYNIGNARYRMGKEVEDRNPQQAIALYEESLLAYKRAMALDPSDEAPKFNHEFVERHSAELKEHLKEQQEQQQQDGQQEEQQQEQQQSGEGEDQEGEEQQAQQPDQESGGEQETRQKEQGAEETAESEEPQPKEAPQEQAQQDGGGPEDESQDTTPERDAQEQAGAAGGAGTEPRGGEMSTAEARTLIDAARGEEVDPAEIQRQVGVAGIGEPKEDW